MQALQKYLYPGIYVNPTDLGTYGLDPLMSPVILEYFFFKRNWNLFICFDTLDLSFPMRASHGRLFATPWTIAHQAPLSMGFFRQEYWSGLPFPTPGDVPHQGSNLGLLYCRWILYCLKHQGSPLAPFTVKFYGKQCAFSTSLSQPCCLNSLPSK